MEWETVDGGVKWEEIYTSYFMVIKGLLMIVMMRIIVLEEKIN